MQRNTTSIQDPTTFWTRSLHKFQPLYSLHKFWLALNKGLSKGWLKVVFVVPVVVEKDATLSTPLAKVHVLSFPRFHCTAHNINLLFWFTLPK